MIQVPGQNQPLQSADALCNPGLFPGPLLLRFQLFRVGLMHHLDPSGGVRQVLHDIPGILPLCAEVYQLIPQGLVKIQLAVVVHHEAADNVMLRVPHDCLAERQGGSSVKHFDPFANGGHFLVRE